MNKWTGKWDKEDFLNFIRTNNIGVEIFESNNNENALLVKVFTFEQMKSLFGGGRTMWAIAIERHYWCSYVSDHNRSQYVWLDFSKDEDNRFSMVAFTVSCEKGIMEACDMRNCSVARYMSEYRAKLTNLGIELENVVELNGISSSTPTPRKVFSLTELV